MTKMQDHFYGLADEISTLLNPSKLFICHLMAEEVDFVRFNHNRVRQAGHVRQLAAVMAF
ncbi:MAG TPA: hypothetical protein VKB53_09610 [Gammaproteobacteria bacterium]|nr:hypothetical protein [Gammaproteobacteria bacterium]